MQSYAVSFCLSLSNFKHTSTATSYLRGLWLRIEALDCFLQLLTQGLSQPHALVQ